jgi:hypothetical protein
LARFGPLADDLTRAIEAADLAALQALFAPPPPSH